MARTPNTSTRQPVAPPPEPEVEDTIYTEIWTTVASYKPDEADQGEGESDQDYFKRLSQAVADVTEPDADGNSEVWNAMSDDAKAWYDSTVTAAEAGEEYPAPDGFYAEGEEAEAEPEPEPEPEPAPKAKSGREALMAFNAKRKADKEAAASSNGGAPAIRPPAARAAAPVRPPAPVAPKRASAPIAPPTPAPRKAAPTLPAARVPMRAARPAAPAAPPAPAARKAPAAKRSAPVEKSKSAVEIVRELIVTNPDVTADQLLDYMTENHQVELKKTTVVSLMTSTRTAMSTIKALGHWKD